MHYNNHQCMKLCKSFLHCQTLKQIYFHCDSFTLRQLYNFIYISRSSVLHILKQLYNLSYRIWTENHCSNYSGNSIMLVIVANQWCCTCSGNSITPVRGATYQYHTYTGNSQTLVIETIHQSNSYSGNSIMLVIVGITNVLHLLRQL